MILSFLLILQQFLELLDFLLELKLLALKYSLKIVSWDTSLEFLFLLTTLLAGFSFFSNHINNLILIKIIPCFLPNHRIGIVLFGKWKNLPFNPQVIHNRHFVSKSKLWSSWRQITAVRKVETDSSILLCVYILKNIKRT